MSGRVRFEALRAGRVAQLEQRDLLDLADALAGQAELAPDLVEGALPAVVQTEPEPDHRLLALAERGEHDLDLVPEHAVGDRVGRLLARVHPGDEVAERALAI